MRVGIGIILSVLSSSVLAAVIPDYDSHGILLARRAVNPDPMDLLWKRADEDQAEPGPSSSEAGAGASNYESSPSRTSNNRGRSALELLQSLKSPQNVITELGEIMSSASAMHRLITDLRDGEYKALISNVGHTKNEVHIKETEARISEMNRYRDRISDALNFIKKQINDGMVTFKERVKGKTKSRFGAFKSGFKKRLGFKKKPSTDETPNQEPSNPEPSDQGPPNQDTSDKDTSDRIHQIRSHQMRRYQIRREQDRYQHHGCQNLIDKPLMFSAVDICRLHLLYRSIQKSIFTILIP
ncbi:hypothetical protein BASA61_007059 [Batrachochytrium salamandrivorans]|nr:hypothetical protein BASA61_007059 [Batrachochytrium salamandrivorans]